MGAQATQPQRAPLVKEKLTADSPASSADPAKIKCNELLRKYTIGQELGQGAFACVYSCKPRASGNVAQRIKDRHNNPTVKDGYYLAAKLVNKKEATLDKIRQEADYLMKLDHPNIVKCHEILEDPAAEFVALILDRQTGGDLMTCMQLHWKKSGKIPTSENKHICAQLLAAVYTLHARSIIHRDIKCDNFLADRTDIVDPQCRLMLGDFGTARECASDKRLSEKCGTKLYWAPETWKRDYGQKADVWSLGVVHYGLMCGKFPYKEEAEIGYKVLQCPKGTPTEFSDFLFSMLQVSERKRATAEEAMASAWIAESKPCSTSVHEFIGRAQL